MTASHQAWLPPIALFDGVLGATALARARLWNKRWFRSPKDLSLKVASGGHDPVASASAWGTPCGGLALGLEEDAPVRLACALLKIKKLPRKLSAADSRLLRAVSDACIRDLLSELMTGLGVSKELGPLAATDLRQLGRDAAMRFTFSVPALPKSFEIHLSHKMAVSARKAQIAAPRAPRPLGVLRSAVETQEINVGACIGWGRVPLADLRALEPDDVLILDEALGKDIALLINGRRTTDPGIELVQTGSTLALRERKVGSRAA